MAETASTVEQVALLILFVLPGISYQFVRERLRGPVPGERDLSERVLRAITVSIALDAVYLIVAGPVLVRFVHQSNRAMFEASADNPRQAAALAPVLFVVIPSAVAWGMSLRE